MIKTILLRMTALSILMAVILLAEDSTSGLHIATRGPHPLSEICLALVNEANWPITYEEPPVLATDELVTKVTPTGIPGLIRRVAPMTVSLTTDQASATGDARLSVINSILSDYSAKGNSDSFRAEQDGIFIHVIPVSARGADGKRQAFEPILGTKIFFAQQSFASLDSLVNTVLGQVSEKRGIQIQVGTIPSGLFRQTPVVAVANDESAQTVLERAFWSINGSRIKANFDPLILTWTLMYEATGRQYWFSVGVINMAHSPGSTTKLSSTNAGSSSGTQNHRPNAVKAEN